MSAGVGMFSGKYPVSKMAFETGLLEEAAKTDENQIALWVQEKYITGMSLKSIF